jgi:hypothetical protein
MKDKILFGSQKSINNSILGTDDNMSLILHTANLAVKIEKYKREFLWVMPRKKFLDISAPLSLNSSTRAK